MPEDAPRILDGFYLPEAFSPPQSLDFRESDIGAGILLRQIVPTPQLLDALADYLRADLDAGLRAMPLASIVERLDAAAAEWLDGTAPDHEIVMDALAATTGFSAAMVRESLRAEQASSRANEMWAALKNEFGDPGVLDTFTSRPGARARVRALGPELTFCFLPGNIPGLSHLPFMRALLVKSPLWCKTSSSEPVYAAAYARTLARLNPEFARRVAVLYWPGGDTACEEVVFRRSAAITAFGTAETCRAVAARARPGTRLVLHGHKLGFAAVAAGSVAEDGVGDLAGRLAHDVAMFDQQACLSPHWIFVEGRDEATRLAEALAKALRGLEAKLPRGQGTPEERVAMGRAWDDIELAIAMGEDVESHAIRGRDSFAVAVDLRRPLRPSCLGRHVSVVPVDSLETLEDALVPFAGYFQNAAIEARERQATALAERLARLGVSRICRPGRMATPAMMWHHDGQSCLEALVRYCDWESE